MKVSTFISKENNLCLKDHTNDEFGFTALTGLKTWHYVTISAI